MVINNRVIFSDEESALISDKMSSPHFTGKTWEDSDLKDLRCKIKKHYSNVQGNICPYCRCDYRSDHGRLWDIEHIIARNDEKNFMFEPLNLCTSCLVCNNEKGVKKVTKSKAKQRYPTKSCSYYIVHPHFDKYKDYIYMLEEGKFYFPIPQPKNSPKIIREKGIKTIKIFGLNSFAEKAGYNKDFDPVTHCMTLLSNVSKSSDTNERKEVLDGVLRYLLNFRVQLEKDRVANDNLSTKNYLADELQSILEIIRLPDNENLCYMLEDFINELRNECNLDKIEKYRDRVEGQISSLSSDFKEIKNHLIVFEGIEKLLGSEV